MVEPGEVVILRALQLGDLLCAVPSFRAMRRAWPSARFALVGLPWSRDFVRRFSLYLDEFIEFPGYPGLPERPVDAAALPRFLSSLQQRRADLAVQMQGDGTVTNALVALFGARAMAGFHVPGQPPPAEGIFVPYPADRNEIRRLLSLAERLGARTTDERLEFPIGEGEEAEWHRLRADTRLVPGQYACLHPGARAEERRWPVEQFARVGKALAERGLRVVVTGDGAEEEERAARLAGAIEGGAITLAGKTELGVLAALIRDAGVLVCNDTGVSHLAAAVRTASVVVFRATEPARWAPLDRTLHRVVIDGPGAVERAVAQARDLLAREAASAA